MSETEREPQPQHAVEVADHLFFTDVVIDGQSVHVNGRTGPTIQEYVATLDPELQEEVMAKYRAAMQERSEQAANRAAQARQQDAERAAADALFERQHGADHLAALRRNARIDAGLQEGVATSPEELRRRRRGLNEEEAAQMLQSEREFADSCREHHLDFSEDSLKLGDVVPGHGEIYRMKIWQNPRSHDLWVGFSFLDEKELWYDLRLPIDREVGIDVTSEQIETEIAAGRFTGPSYDDRISYGWSEDNKG